ncbi:transposase [Streptomyces sp. NPDC012935]|uniref:transposase n=1 Tax=Streptomyces sp. NPDC012935 TaxID=3364857 RepID=UPI003680CA66
MLRWLKTVVVSDEEKAPERCQVGTPTRPDSSAYATQLRLISARIVEAVNSAVGTDVVRTIRVLAVGAAPAPRTMGSAPAAAVLPEARVKTRETASPGYKEALALHQAVASPSRIDPGIAEAVERQTRAMRQLSRRAFPESEASSDDQPAAIEAFNNLIKRIKRAGFGFRRFRNYRVRALLYADKPNSDCSPPSRPTETEEPVNGA